MNVKNRLTIMNFFQFFTWGLWLITFSAYAFKTLHFTGTQIGAVYGTMGIASVFMPGIIGIIADRWINAEKLYAVCHFIGAVMLFSASRITSPEAMFWIMLLNALVYMPTIPLASAICYRILTDNNYNVVNSYPPIRVWGTVAFIVALWTISLLGFELSPVQLYFASASALFLSIYSFTLPACAPITLAKAGSWVSYLGLDAFVLFKKAKMAIFFIFSLLIGVALQINNTYCSTFLHDFDINPLYKNAFGVTHSAILMSVSQMSETLFILAIPFVLRKFGIKVVMLMSVFAWVIRFGLLAYGDPGYGLWMLILSMIIFGCAFDFFNISCSLFVEVETPAKIRASAQGLFFIMTLGIGGFLGAFGGGVTIDLFTRLINNEAIRNWHTIWLVFAAYAFVIGLLFMMIFKHKHDPKAVESFKH